MQTSQVTQPHGSAPLAVQFNDTSSNSPNSWNWDFGDSGKSTNQNPTHSYTTSGTYNVTLITTNRLSLNNYQVYIPTNAVKGTTGNKNSKYVLNFKTNKY
ncbi:MAG: PKD domain-containing protein [Methanobacterium sp. ERen5]|nr:MAG: PKD domain-containing protein [Methanobacterium sp. ERen5]